MSQYRIGTVTVTNGDATVTNTDVVNSKFLTEVQGGDLFTVVGTGIVYQVASVTDDTNLELTAPYTGTTGTFDYTISRDFTPINNIPIINAQDIEKAAILTRALTIIDGLL